MIKSISILNFQSHKQTTIDFSDGVNALVGLSDSGKTAVIRALRWVLFNKPGGDAFRSYWGGDTSVQIVLSSGDVIGRVKTKTDNLYVVNGKDLAGFGQDVPEEVKAILNINNINFSSQMDSPFMLGDSPGDVAQQLNKAAQLDLIDKSASALRKRISSVSSDLKHNVNQLTEQEARLKEFDFIPGLEIDVQKLETSYQLVINKRREHQALSTLWHDARNSLQTIKQLDQQIPSVTSVQALEQGVDALQEKNSTRKALDGLLDDIDTTEQVIERCKGVEGADKALQGLEKLVLKLREKKAYFRSFDMLRMETVADTDTVDRLSEDVTNLKEEFEQAFPDVCPLCDK